ncbi:MAG: hypothetical protein JST50_20415 [Bacteroidetes bacterium]|jgi:hypothetical protein|nr:hypothetical protein [Bacteroidota bacterium]
MNKYLIISKNWLGYAAVVTLLCFLVYIIAQQNFRQSANDPQFQLAQDAVNAINKGTDPKLLTGTQPLDIASTLSPYVLIYDTNGSEIGNNITLDGKIPEMPDGVLNKTRSNGINTVTWQPRAGLRQAIVMMATHKGYVVVASRSLQTTEDHIATLGSQVLFGWIVSLVAMLVVVMLQESMTSKMSHA